MKAFIIVDMIKDFIAPEGALTVGAPGQEIVPFVVEKVAQHRAQGDAVIYLCDCHEVDDAEFKMFPPHCITGTEGAAVIEELAPETGDKIISKRRYSGFFATDLDIYLREKNIQEIILVGVCTNICVLYTAADARNLGYDVTIYKRGVASFNERAHQLCLEEMKHTLGCDIVEE